MCFVGFPPLQFWSNLWVELASYKKYCYVLLDVILQDFSVVKIARQLRSHCSNKATLNSDLPSVLVSIVVG